MDNSFPLGSAGIVPVRTGNLLLGIRSNQPSVLDEFRRVLGPSIVDLPSGVVVPPNISVRLGESDGRVRSVPYVYRRGGLAQIGRAHV